ncbi:MAG TPA: GNAT family N-acetyltransferase [Pyrinomonadaceae bacterium]|nr:GNAT family N-acetyltransferase [Pyrinomonadaceae bacterium]
MDQITIRPATIDDLETLLAFEQGIIETERPFDPTVRTGTGVHYYDLAELVASSDAEVLVAEINGEIIASGYARIEQAKAYRTYRQYSYLGFMFVAPQHRGKGVNNLILDALEKWSLSRGVTELRLEVYSENANAIRAYKKAGYETLTLMMRKELG